MGIVNDWQKKLRTLRESPFPQFYEPPVNSTIGGLNQQSKLGEPVEPIPTIDVNDEANHCSIECDALREIIIWAGADQAEAEKIIDKIKILNKEVGIVKSDNLDDILVKSDQPTAANGLTTIDPVAPNGLMTGRGLVYKYNENLEKVMNDEEVEIIGKKDEKK